MNACMQEYILTGYLFGEYASLRNYEVFSRLALDSYENISKNEKGNSNMHYLYEYGDILNSPYECFIFDTAIHSFPIRQHWHYYMEILFMLNGTALVSCKDTEYILHPGEMITLPPKELHAIYATSNERLRYYVLKFDLKRFHEDGALSPQLKAVVQQALSDPNSSIHFLAPQMQKYPIQGYIRACSNEYEQRGYGYLTAMHAAITCLLLAMVRIWRSHGFIPSKAAPEPASHSIDTITEYIDAHSNQSLRVEDLALRCNMSYSFFAKKFKQLYGRSCKEYIEYVRVTKTEDLLLFTDYDLAYISRETGFSDCSHMIKTFRKYKNITPKQFRMQNTKTLH